MHRFIKNILMLFMLWMLSTAYGVNNGVTVFNAGVGGHNSADGLARMTKDVLALKPQGLIIEFGINDALNPKRLIEPDKFSENMNEIVHQAKDAGIKYIAVVTLHQVIESYVRERHANYPFTEDLNSRISQYNRKIQALAQEQNLLLVDFNSIAGTASEAASSLIRNAANSHSRDGIHLTPAGARRLAETVADVLFPSVKDGDKIICFGDSITWGASLKGSGTATGETYPAQLQLLLNKRTGMSVTTQTPDFKNAESLSNSFIALQLASPEQGGGILSIKNAVGKEFINLKTSASVWKIKLKKVKSGKANPAVINLTIDPEQDDGTSNKNSEQQTDELEISSAKLKVDCRIVKEQAGMKYLWTGIDIGSEKKVLDVWVSFALDAKDPFCRIKAGFDNRSTEYTVFYFTAPRLEGIGAMDGRPELDQLATPSYNGRLILNPVNKGLLGKQQIFQPNRSGHSMQFDAYSNSGHGLYLGCFDGLQYAKRHQLETSPESGICWAIVNVPNNMKSVPQRWEVPYESVIRCFSGDWYDACQIYRDWALKQSWSSEGPVLTRKSIPQSFKEIDEWLSMALGQMTSFRTEFDQMSKDFKPFNMGVMCFSWGKDHFFSQHNPERFPLDAKDKEYLKLAAENKIKVMGYIQFTGWDDTTASFQAADGYKNSVKNFAGQSLKWPDTPDLKKTTGSAVVAYPGKAWSQVLGDAVEKMAQAGFDAAYLDSGNHGGTYFNFNSECSADSGGGNSYIKGSQQLMENLRSRARKINPDFSFTAESFWEGNIAQLDGILVCNTTNIYLEKDRVLAIPMAQTVYHDYAIMFSAWPSKWDLERDNGRGYIAKFGLAFVWGVKGGWNMLPLLYKYPNHAIALESSLKRYEAYSRARQFLLYGQMLRQPAIISPCESLPVKWHKSYSEKYYDINMPAILCSAWRSPDGKFGVALYNISEKNQRVSLKLNKAEYGLSQRNKYEFTPLYPSGGNIQAQNSNDCITLNLEIPAYSPAVYEL